MDLDIPKINVLKIVQLTLASELPKPILRMKDNGVVEEMKMDNNTIVIIENTEIGIKCHRIDISTFNKIFLIQRQLDDKYLCSYDETIGILALNIDSPLAIELLKFNNNKTDVEKI
jgi:hypothetical protein